MIAKDSETTNIFIEKVILYNYFKFLRLQVQTLTPQELQSTQARKTEFETKNNLELDYNVYTGTVGGSYERSVKAKNSSDELFKYALDKTFPF